MDSFGLTNRVKSFTREFKSSRTLIDHVFTNSEDENFRCSVIVSALSDHHAQLATLIFPNTKTSPAPRSIFCRKFTHSAKEYFEILLKE